MNPSRITDPKKADLAVEIWEGHIGNLDSKYGETLSSMMTKTMTSMRTLCASLVKTTWEKGAGEELVSRAECSGIGRQSARTNL